MEGGIERRIDTLKLRTEVKSLVSQAAKEAVTEIALKYGIAPQNAGSADRAIDEALLAYESTGDHEHLPDLKNIALDAATDIFHSLGFNQPELMTDFMNEMNKVLGHPDVGD